MKALNTFTLSMALILAGLAPLNAGQPTLTSPIATPPAPVSDWEVTATPYLWMAGIEGTMGVAGFTADVDVPFTDILDHLDMAAALQLEVRHDRWLLLLDGMYLKASVDSETPGRLFSSVGVEVEQVMAEAALGYRLIEGKRGFLDVFAGARYLYLETGLSLNLDSAGVRDISEDISHAAVTQVSKAVQQAVSDNAPELKGKASTKIGAAAQSHIAEAVHAILAAHPNLPAAVAAFKSGSGPINGAIKELIAAKSAEQQATLADATAAVSAQVAAAKAKARSQLSRAVARAEKKLADAIEQSIKDTIPEHVSGSKSWVDPIVGLRGRYSFSDRFYALVRADFGGFGVGSDLAWQVYAALGYELCKHTTLELGYRYLAVDYHDGGFTYDVDTSGAMLAMGFHF